MKLIVFSSLLGLMLILLLINGCSEPVDDTENSAPQVEESTEEIEVSETMEDLDDLDSLDAEFEDLSFEELEDLDFE